MSPLSYQLLQVGKSPTSPIEFEQFQVQRIRPEEQ